jgi:YgiT-type zinc finger domain-containing protein
MNGKEEKIVPNSRCPLCGGGLIEGLASLPFFLGERIVVVKDVPSEVCADCGEPYMKSGVAGRVETLLDRLDELDTEMSVVHYKAA